MAAGFGLLPKGESELAQAGVCVCVCVCSQKAVVIGSDADAACLHFRLSS